MHGVEKIFNSMARNLQPTCTTQTITLGPTSFTLGRKSGFNDRRTREKTLWTSWSAGLSLASLSSSASCSTVNTFLGVPGSGDRLCTNKCLTLGSLMASICVILAAENKKQTKSTKIWRTSFSMFDEQGFLLRLGPRSETGTKLRNDLRKSREDVKWRHAKRQWLRKKKKYFF